MVVKSCIIAALMCINIFLLQAQDFTIVRVERSGANLMLYYNLIDSARNRLYTVNLFSSADNYTSPLQKVTGEIGLEVKPGASKKTKWTLNSYLINRTHTLK